MPRIESAAPEPIELPNWGDFQLAMASDPAYQRVSAASDKLTVGRVERFFAIAGSAYGFLVQLWMLMLLYCPEEQRPKPEDSARWNAIASANSMPFEFTETGQLKIKET